LPGRDDRTAITVVVFVVGWIAALRRVLIGGHRPHVGRIDTIGQVEQAARRGLLDESVKDLVNDVFEVAEKAIDRISRRWSIEARAQLDDRVSKLLFNRTNAVDVLVTAV